MDQVAQVAGSLLILAAYVAVQRGRMSQRSWTYLGLNLVGSALLAVLAVYERQAGFFLLEACWAAFSAWSIVERLRGREPGAGH